MVVAMLAKSDCIGAAVILHPGKISIEEIEGISLLAQTFISHYKFIIY